MLTKLHVGIQGLQEEVEPFEHERPPRMDRSEQAEEDPKVQSEMVVWLNLCAFVQLLRDHEIFVHEFFGALNTALVDLHKTTDFDSFDQV